MNEPRLMLRGIISRIIDVRSSNIKHILSNADLTLSNPMSTIDRKINGFEQCLIVAVHPKYIFLKILISTYFFYSFIYHINGNSFLCGIVQAMRAFLDVIWEGYLTLIPKLFSTEYRAHQYIDWSSMCYGNRSFILMARRTIWKN